jgi:putative addiction module component (TIGR02574 family)
MAALSRDEVSALSTEERPALIDELWDSLWDSLDAPLLEASIETAHREVPSERLAEYYPSSDELLTLDEVSDRLRAR